MKPYLFLYKKEMEKKLRKIVVTEDEGIKEANLSLLWSLYFSKNSRGQNNEYAVFWLALSYHL